MAKNFKPSNEITCEVEETLAVYPANEQTGWAREINLVRWNGADPKLDIRDWNPDHTRKSKGLTFTYEEAEILYEALRGLFGPDDAIAEAELLFD